MLHFSETQQHQGNNAINQINKVMFYRLWTYKKILFLLFTLSMTISFSYYNYNKKWDTIYLIQF
jgi:zona occludens toxin (predicted ATPase)